MKIAFILLGALGSIVRTMPIVRAIRKKYPEAEITWITEENALGILEGFEEIDKVEKIPFETNEEFDLVYNLDIDQEATKLVENINAKEKKGFYKEGEFTLAYNFGAEEYLNTLFDDQMKKENRKTYQELMFKAADLEYSGERTPIRLSECDKKYATNFFKNKKVDSDKLIGIHVGASPRWPSKKWDEERIKKFIIKAREENYEVILFGGKDEMEKHEKLYNELKERGIEIYRNDPNNTIREFFSLVDKCNYMVCSDSFSLHASLALGKKTIGLFFCTSPYEIEDYGLLVKIISEKLEEFFPEKMDEHNTDLTKSIHENKVLEIISGLKGKRVVNAIIMDKESKKFLIVKRKEGLHKGLWAFPGGIIEERENVFNALKREIKEEIGLKLTKIERKISEYVYDRKNGEKTIGESYLVKVDEGKLKIDKKEIEEAKWVTFSEFEDYDKIEGLDEEAFTAIIRNGKK